MNSKPMLKKEYLMNNITIEMPAINSGRPGQTIIIKERFRLLPDLQESPEQTQYYDKN